MFSNTLPQAPAAQRNKFPLLQYLDKYIDRTSSKTLFEIGSGTLDHALFFSRMYPKLTWTPSDSENRSKMINLFLQENSYTNIKPMSSYLCGKTPPPKEIFDYIFTANTLHIMSWSECLHLFEDLKSLMKVGTYFFLYGPFKHNESYTSYSNKEFDKFLRTNNPLSGIRDIEEIKTILLKKNIIFFDQHYLPANNELYIFTKKD